MTRGHLVGVAALLIVLSLLALIVTGAVLGGGWRWVGAGAGAVCAAVMVAGVVADRRDSKGEQ
ncbi:hypothetical protein [Gordonia jacobaea]|uniref:hypothetical protein n=1 Tax=Gordonia jacobaea TaxID=122202 RepID=UPI0022E351CF|nr:hypothetical protein [Gordonia jacobaea]